MAWGDNGTIREGKTAARMGFDYNLNPYRRASRAAANENDYRRFEELAMCWDSGYVSIPRAEWGTVI
jgi:hypothetical protein